MTSARIISTVPNHRKIEVLTPATLVGLRDGLDDTDGNGLSHVTDGKALERQRGTQMDGRNTYRPRGG